MSRHPLPRSLPIPIPILAALLLAFCGSASAHETWLVIQTTGPGKGVAELGTGNRFPKSDSAVAVDRIEKGLIRIGARDMGSFAEPRADGKVTRLAATWSGTGVAAAALQLFPKSITLDAAKFEAYLKEIGADAALALRKAKGETKRPGRELYQKLPKCLVKLGDSPVKVAPPLGLPLEFLLDDDAFDLKPGRPVTLTLFRNRTGVVAQLVRAFDAKGKVIFSGKTNSNGQVEIPLKQPGRILIAATALERLDGNKDADWQSFWASLTLEIRK